VLVPQEPQPYLPVQPMPSASQVPQDGLLAGLGGL
jgi:hypothetical protein